MTAILDAAAEALRRYEQGGKRLNSWDTIPAVRKEIWRTKAMLVLAAMFAEAKRDPAVIEAMQFAAISTNGLAKGGFLAALHALKTHVLGE